MCLFSGSKVGAVYVASLVLYKNDGMDWSLFCIVLSVHLIPLFLIIERGI